MVQNSRAEQSRAIMTFNSKELFGKATRGKRLKAQTVSLVICHLLQENQKQVFLIISVMMFKYLI